nr:MAG TPA: hypothetical protein [Caudoviricetes sp.]
MGEERSRKVRLRISRVMVPSSRSFWISSPYFFSNSAQCTQL